MLSFDEFKAVQRRENLNKPDNKSINKSVNSANKDNNKPKVQIVKKEFNEFDDLQKKKDNKNNDEINNKNAKTDASKNKYFSKVTDAIGEFLELHQMQAFYVLLVILDTFSCLTELNLLYNGDQIKKIIPFLGQPQLLKIFQTFSIFTRLFFICENIAIALIFNISIINHWGYLMDIMTLLLQNLMEEEGYGRESRILNIIRLWRLVRLFNSLVNIEKEMHEETTNKLEEKTTSLKKIENENITLKDELRREKEAKDSVEEMLQSYKDEVDTLNEALKIAAMDIAEVANADDELFQSEDDEDELVSKLSGTNNSKNNTIDDEGSSLYGDPVGYRNKFSSKEAMMKAIMQDMNNDNKKIQGNNQNSTFLVHEDGTFEQK